jgi:hypothetical protein
LFSPVDTTFPLPLSCQANAVLLPPTQPTNNLLMITQLLLHGDHMPPHPVTPSLEIQLQIKEKKQNKKKLSNIQIKSTLKNKK